MTGKAMLRLEALSCGYGRFRAVHSLDLEVSKGSVHALLGANEIGRAHV